MDRSLTDKVVIVTGGVQGIGYDIADKYIAEGAKTVILLDINETKGEEAISTLTEKHGCGKAIFVKCDVTKDLEDISKQILDEYKQVDVLVNNAGIVDERCARKMMEVNAMAVLEWTMKFWEHMRKDKGGQGGTILNIGSIYSFAVDPYLVFKTTAKFAVMGLTRSLGHEYNFNKLGVRVIILCPGFTTTTCYWEYWEEHIPEFGNFIAAQWWQLVKDVGKAAVTVFETAESGSAWKIVGADLSEIVLVPEGDYLR